MRVLAITSLFPNPCDPLFSPFNAQQFSALARHCEVEVISPIPWFPGASRLSPRSRSGRLHRVPAHDTVDGLLVTYPRYLHVPKLGDWSAGPLLTAGLYRRVQKYRGMIDVVLGAWAYPDGWASIVLGRALGVPAVVKLHGSDMNVVARLSGPRFMLRRVLPHAARVVAVSRPLGDLAVGLGVNPDRIDIVLNGVDQRVFSVKDRHEARQALGLDPQARLILYVGSLSREKGIGELLDAFDAIADPASGIRLAILGDGPMRAACEASAARHAGRIVVPGPQPLSVVAQWMNACDVLTLPSWNEGTPNVVLEALTCGRRIVATDVGGIPDVVDDPILGSLVPRRNVPALACALRTETQADYDPREVASRGGRGSWTESAGNLHKVLATAISDRNRTHSRVTARL